MVAQRQAARTPKAKAPPPAPEREPVREAAREKIVTGWVDENGEPIIRKNRGGQSPREFKPHEIPEGMAYQWIRHLVFGDPSESEVTDMMEAGWRPVPWIRHKNRFQPSYLSKADENNDKGCIINKGDLLVERPLYMNKEAEIERQRDVDMQINSVFQSKGVPLPDNVRQMGLESRQGNVNRRTSDVGSVRSEFMPKHEIALDQ